jgi:hypothetical protein
MGTLAGSEGMPLKIPGGSLAGGGLVLFRT